MNTMNTKILPASLVQEADNLSKETGLNFRDCLSILVAQSEPLLTKTEEILTSVASK